MNGGTEEALGVGRSELGREGARFSVASAGGHRTNPERLALFGERAARVHARVTIEERAARGGLATSEREASVVEEASLSDE